MSLPKLIVILLLPLGIMLLLLAAALWASLKKRRTAASLGIAFTMMIIWSGGMPVTARWAAGLVEARHPMLTVEQAPSAQAIIVLGGGVALPSPQDTIAIGPNANRAWFAALLHRAGKAPTILVSGGGDSPEAPRIKALLTGWGLPADQILLEQESLNTRENAHQSRLLLEPLGVERILLVTTAMHMPRAAASFTKEGFLVNAFPVGFQSISYPERSLVIRDFLPDVEALESTSKALLELIGGIYYRLREWS